MSAGEKPAKPYKSAPAGSLTRATEFRATAACDDCDLRREGTTRAAGGDVVRWARWHARQAGHAVRVETATVTRFTPGTVVS